MILSGQPQLWMIYCHSYRQFHYMISNNFFPTTSTNHHFSINNYFHLLPFNQIFPDDLIQYILWWLISYKSCQQQWKQLSIKMKILLQQSYKKVEQQQYPITYNPKYNNTWIVNQHRTKLHPIEQS